MLGYYFAPCVCVCVCRYMSLSLALRYVLDALKKGSTTKMHLFGLAALDKFRKRIKDFPQYCSNIASIPHFHQFPVHLRQVSGMKKLFLRRVYCRFGILQFIWWFTVKLILHIDFHVL